MANTAGPATFSGGLPLAQPTYLVDANGNPISGSNGNPINLAEVGGALVALGQAVMANGIPVTVASNQTPLTASTGAKTSVASNASSSVTILAANTNRKGALIYNDSTAILYLDLSGDTASSISYSVQIGAQGYFELPPQPVYTGAITGIWASANGNARVTEFS